MNFKIIYGSILVCGLFISACEDQGTAPVIAPTLEISRINPSATLTNDTVEINGTNFGSAQGTSVVNFGTTSAAIVSWSNIQIKAVVPNSLDIGSTNVSIIVGGQSSNAKIFQVITSNQIVSFTSDITLLFSSKGCANASCHGSSRSGGLTVVSYPSLKEGNSLHGPVITPGDGEGSVIVKKLKGTAGFGSQMPLGGNPLSSAEIQKFIDWINQGALNN